ncbi:MAG: hypothetical protein ACTSR0_04140 [Candidatus Asgardarchaeia archaeon]
MYYEFIVHKKCYEIRFKNDRLFIRLAWRRKKMIYAFYNIFKMIIKKRRRTFIQSELRECLKNIYSFQGLTAFIKKLMRVGLLKKFSYDELVMSLRDKKHIRIIADIKKRRGWKMWGHEMTCKYYQFTPEFIEICYLLFPDKPIVVCEEEATYLDYLHGLVRENEV